MASADAPKVGDTREMTPREVLERRAGRFIAGKLCLMFGLFPKVITKAAVAALGDELEDAGRACETLEDLLEGVAV